MFLSSIKLWNFRKYGTDDNSFDLTKPNLEIPLKKGMNVLIGENDSGKTAIIDAVKLVLHTQSFEWLRIEKDDFHNEANRLRIELIFRELSDDEAKNFIEWLSYTETPVNPYLRLILDVQRNNDKIFPYETCAGSDKNGFPLTAEARDLLKVTYLKPLRDAESELSPGRYSRLATILSSNPLFIDGNGKESIEKALDAFNNSINDVFQESECNQIKKVLDEYIKSFCSEEDETLISLSNKGDLRSILQRLSLYFNEKKNLGLGTLNRLYMAAELLNLRKDNWYGAKLCLIEELEAHLHPQAQMKVIEKLQEQRDIQYILTTHSPNLASKLKLSDLILCNNESCFPLGKEYTELHTNDYIFLEKFLDTTKANLFFAKGLIFVEGWSESIFLPEFAKLLRKHNILPKNLTEAGVSIINVGSVAFLRYVNIFKRKDRKLCNIPIAVITDTDIKFWEKNTSSNELERRNKATVKLEIEEKIDSLENTFNYNSIIKVFPAIDWTFEYALYKSSTLGPLFEETTKKLHSKMEEPFEKSLAQKLIKQKLKKTEIAYSISSALESLSVSKEDLLSDSSISYLINALKHVCV